MRIKKLHDIPEEVMHLGYAILTDINEAYVLTGDGRLWSRKSNQFIQSIKYYDKFQGYAIIKKNGKQSIYSKNKLMGKYFSTINEYMKGEAFTEAKYYEAIGEDYKEVKNYEDYLITKSGKLFSIKQYKFITPKVTQTGWPVFSLMKDKKRVTAYLAHIVFNSWVGDIPEGYRLHFINGNKADCRIENIVLQKIVSYHKRLQKENKQN